jgi:GNAT superfamily N-acetyltransferase
MEILIRDALASDLPAIHGLVRELAIYEKAESAFTATLAAYEADFAQGVFQAKVAEVEGKVVGMVLFFMHYSTWKGKMLYLEDFVVKEAYRGKGIGRLLFNAFLEEAKNRGCALVKWQVLDWNRPALDFYEKFGAVIEKEWWTGKIFFQV